MTWERECVIMITVLHSNIIFCLGFQLSWGCMKIMKIHDMKYCFLPRLEIDNDKYHVDTTLVQGSPGRKSPWNSYLPSSQDYSTVRQS